MKQNAFISALVSEPVIKFIVALIRFDFTVYSSNVELTKIDNLIKRARPEDNNYDLIFVDLYPIPARRHNWPLTTPPVDFSFIQLAGLLNLRSVVGKQIILVDQRDLEPTINWFEQGSSFPQEFRAKYIAKAEFLLAQYFLTLAQEHGNGQYEGILGEQALLCEYGENAYQAPAQVYLNPLRPPDGLDFRNYESVSGRTLSFNNICDGDRLLQTMTHVAATFDLNRGKVPFIALGVKHGNACGASYDYHDTKEAVCKMVVGDPQAIFGGLVMLNFPLDEEIADLLLRYGSDSKRLFDGIFAPGFSEGGAAMFKRKEQKCRLVELPGLEALNKDSLDSSRLLRPLRNGNFLAQPNYTFILSLTDPDLKKYGPELNSELEDYLLFAKAIGDTSNSNTITIVQNKQLHGNGVGQQSRVWGTKLATQIAKEFHGQTCCVVSSDSFFPFVDGVEVLHKYGATAIIATSGSIRDQEIINYCVEKGISLYLIPDKKGRGFFNH